MTPRPLPTFLAVLALSAPLAPAQQPANSPAFQPTIGTGALSPAAAATAAPPVRPRRENPVTSIQEFVRIEGYARSTLRGIGIVVGLPGTGDKGTELVLARPLAQVHANNGNPLESLATLGNAKSAAIVMVSCTIPEGGGRYGDTYDVFVQALHSAKSLKGGTLIISPLLGPRTDDPNNPYAIAQGPIFLEESDVATSGRITGGAQLIKDIRPRSVGTSFNLILRPPYHSFAVARTIAAEINGITADLENDSDAGEPIAAALDDTTIRIVIPPQERNNPANFMASVMTKRFSPSLIDLPAMVVVNERTGSIVVTGDVEISSVTVGNDKLIVTTTTPAPVPSPSNPLIEQNHWTEFGSTRTGGENARIQDLLDAFKHLNVPAREQIQILAQINQAGRLHARFVRE